MKGVKRMSGYAFIGGIIIGIIFMLAVAGNKEQKK